MPTLIITDLDAVAEVDKGGKVVKESAQPCYGAAQTTANHVLKTWLPKRAEIDMLLAPPLKALCYSAPDRPIAVAYQTPQGVKQGARTQAITPSTFEDALVLTNPKAVTDAARAEFSCRMTRAFAKSIAEAQAPQDLAKALFDRLDKYPEKAAFALDLLYVEDMKALRAPPYIDAGLTWLAGQLKGVEGVLCKM